MMNKSLLNDLFVYLMMFIIVLILSLSWAFLIINEDKNKKK
jgi:hypothetical protein